MPTQGRFNHSQHIKFEYLSVWMSHSWQVRSSCSSEWQDLACCLSQARSPWLSAVTVRARHCSCTAPWAGTAEAAGEALPHSQTTLQARPRPQCCKSLVQHFNPSSRGRIAFRHAKDTIHYQGHPCPHQQDPQALHFRSGLTLPPRLEVPVHRRGLHVGGELRQGAGEFFSADHGEGEGGGAGAHGDVAVGGAVGGGRGGRGAGAHGHVAVLRAVGRAQRGEAARLQGTAGTEKGLH